jgi:RNA polymerase sigma-70 factor (ECF subfamily)
MTTRVAVLDGLPSVAGHAAEAEMIVRLRAGDEEAYESLFRAHAGSMLAVARKFLGNSDDAADAVQDAFLSAFRGVRAFEGTARLGTWLHQITVNACLMKLRSRRRCRHVPLADRTLSAHAKEDELTRWEAANQVRDCIARLPSAYRTVLWLRDIEGLDTSAAAGRLGTSEGVVKTRLHRARHALRALLEPAVCASGPGNTLPPPRAMRHLPTGGKGRHGPLKDEGKVFPVG